MSENIESFFPFLLIIGVAIIKGVLKKAKKQKREGEKRVDRPPSKTPSPSRPQSRPSVMEIAKPKPIEPPKTLVNKRSHQKKRPRIAKLIGGLKSKKELVLLSEILIAKHQL